MKSLLSVLIILVFSILAATTAKAVEQSYSVRCQYFHKDNLLPALRSGDFLVQTVNEITSIRLRNSDSEVAMTVRRPFEQDQRANEPIVHQNELTSDNSLKYVIFFRDTVTIQQKDSSGRPVSAMSCQGTQVARVADRLLGITDGTGPMETAMIHLTGRIERRPVIAAIPAPSDIPPIPQVPVSVPVAVPVTQGITITQVPARVVVTPEPDVTPAPALAPAPSSVATNLPPQVLENLDNFFKN